MPSGTFYSNLSHCGRIFWNVKNYNSTLSTSKNPWGWCRYWWRPINVYKVYRWCFEFVFIYMVYCWKYLGLQQVQTTSNSIAFWPIELLQPNTLYVCLLGHHGELHSYGLNMFLYLLSWCLRKLYSLLCHCKRLEQWYQQYVCAMTFYCISHVLYALWLVDLVVHILKYGLLDFMVCFPVKFTIHEIQQASLILDSFSQSVL